MSVFRQIQELISIEMVAERYGVHIKNKKASCPFHNDGKTPNLSFKNNHYKCFSCGAGGDTVDFVARLFGISPLESVKKLNEDFALGIDIGKPIDKAVYTRIKQENEILDKFHEWERNAFTEIIHRLEWCRIVINNTAPFSDLWSQAINEQCLLEYKADVLTFGTIKDKTEFYKSNKVVNICDKQDKMKLTS